MDIERAISRILANTYTKTDCYRRLALLQDFLDHVQFGGGGVQSSWAPALQERYGARESADTIAAVASWEEDLKALASTQGNQQVQALKQAIEKLPELVLYVPVLFDAPQVAAIGAWCRTQVDPKVLLDLRTDPAAVGGCSFVWKSTLYDFSLSYFMAKNRDKFKTLVESVVRV